MPELPEVETVRRDVSRRYAGHALLDVAITGRRTVRRHPPEALASLAGQQLAGTGRHGKYLLLEWEDGRVLVVHLRMSGQLLAAAAGEPRPVHTHAVLAFAGAGELRFVDPRTFGELFVAGPAPGPGPGGGPAGPAGLVELGHLGRDALAVDAAYLRAALAGRRAPLKRLLVDQRAVAGLGNIYADEVCYDAGLRPDRPAGSLTPAELRRLAVSVRSVLEAAIASRGSSLRDQQYRDLYGNLGRYQLEHKVYGRSGMPCLSCGQAVQRLDMGARSAFLCAVCQS
ncbi:MAG: bifunctional DNA-formamidopyrimidine glycosylase/DNA-(apurinic or apyrimidinic site) lyase [Acidimicrobiales bacterium]